MKITSILCFVLVACDAYPVAYADQKISKFTTHFELSSVDENAEIQTAYAPYVDSEIVMPSGSRWNCYVMKVERSKTDPHLLTAGFICRSIGGGMITATNVACYDDKVSYRNSSMTVSSLAETNTNFNVSCETKALK